MNSNVEPAQGPLIRPVNIQMIKFLSGSSCQLSPAEVVGLAYANFSPNAEMLPHASSQLYISNYLLQRFLFTYLYYILLIKKNDYTNPKLSNPNPHPDPNF